MIYPTLARVFFVLFYLDIFNKQNLYSTIDFRVYVIAITDNNISGSNIFISRKNQNRNRPIQVPKKGKHIEERGMDRCENIRYLLTRNINENEAF